MFYTKKKCVKHFPSSNKSLQFLPSHCPYQTPLNKMTKVTLKSLYQIVFTTFFFFGENISTTWNMNKIENAFEIFKMIKYSWNLQNDQYTPKMKYEQNSFKILKMTKICSSRTSEMNN